MARKPALHSVDDLLLPGLERTIAAADLGPEDDAVVAECRVIAAAIDRMSNAERRAMLGQTIPQYHRAIQELDKRIVRRAKQLPKREPSALDRLRMANARSVRP